ncbi:MAG TPA: hypothetical protein PKV27_13280, partial [Ilumatobacteraceae bacterium]|nr:hypothetical protein [Ilumatobacteraceae bacterium]
MPDTRHDHNSLHAPDFVDRHIGFDDHELSIMLAAIGVESVDQLLEQTIPASIRLRQPLALDPPRHVDDVLGELRQLAGRTVARTSLIGQGYYPTIVPPVIQRN